MGELAEGRGRDGGRKGQGHAGGFGLGGQGGLVLREGGEDTVGGGGGDGGGEDVGAGRGGGGRRLVYDCGGGGGLGVGEEGEGGEDDGAAGEEHGFCGCGVFFKDAFLCVCVGEGCGDGL